MNTFDSTVYKRQNIQPEKLLRNTIIRLFLYFYSSVYQRGRAQPTGVLEARLLLDIHIFLALIINQKIQVGDAVPTLLVKVITEEGGKRCLSNRQKK